MTHWHRFELGRQTAHHYHKAQMLNLLWLLCLKSIHWKLRASFAEAHSNMRMRIMCIVSGRERDHGELWVNVVEFVSLRSVLTPLTHHSMRRVFHSKLWISIVQVNRLQLTSISKFEYIGIWSCFLGGDAVCTYISLATQQRFCQILHILGKCKYIKVMGNTASCLHWYQYINVFSSQRETLACLRLPNFRFSIDTIGISHLNERMGDVVGSKCNICQYHYQSHEWAFCLKYERINGGANRSRSSKTVMLQEYHRFFFFFRLHAKYGSKYKDWPPKRYGLYLKKLKKNKNNRHTRACRLYQLMGIWRAKNNIVSCSQFMPTICTAKFNR